MKPGEKVPQQAHNNTHWRSRRKLGAPISIDDANVLHVVLSVRLISSLDHSGRQVEVRDERLLPVEAQLVTALHIDRERTRATRDTPRRGW